MLSLPSRDLSWNSLIYPSKKRNMILKVFSLILSVFSKTILLTKDKILKKAEPRQIGTKGAALTPTELRTPARNISREETLRVGLPWRHHPHLGGIRTLCVRSHL